MPVEGQWERSNTPLGRRDKWLLAAVGAITVVVVAAVGGFYAFHSSSSADRGCLVTTVASTMGGARLRVCGAKARALCRTSGRDDRAVASACRRQGYAVGG